LFSCSHRQTQLAVAAKMQAVAAATRAYDAVVSTGDNFYYNGVASVQDPLFRTVFESIYTQPALQVPWYPIVGNHDCRGASPRPPCSCALCVCLCALCVCVCV
jgi:hypothetical protein